MENTGKYISGIIMLLLAVGIFFYGQSLLSNNCTGLGWLNPLNFCILGFIGTVLAVGLAVWFAIFGMLIFALPADKAPWAILLAVILPAAVINWFIPDPIPFIDEILMTLVSLIAGMKLLGSSAPKQIQNMF
jgi:hypothetical protein